MKHERRPYTSAFYLWRGTSALFFSSCVTPPHCHNTLQIIFDTQTEFRFRLRNEEWKTCKSLLIREGVIHQLDTNNSVQLIIYADPSLTLVQSLKARYLKDKDTAILDNNIFHFANSASLQSILLKPDAAFFEQQVMKILEALAGESVKQGIDTRVRKIEQMVSVTDPHLITTRLLADMVHLSESRMRSLFKKSTGIPLHRYILWNKIRFATNRLMAGASIQDAAFDAGFTDSSHLHKMMSQMFGVTPSQFLKDNRSMNIIVGDSQPIDFQTLYF